MDLAVAELAEPADHVVTENATGAKVFLDEPAAQFLDDKVLDANQTVEGDMRSPSARRTLCPTRSGDHEPAPDAGRRPPHSRAEGERSGRTAASIARSGGWPCTSAWCMASSWLAVGFRSPRPQLCRSAGVVRGGGGGAPDSCRRGRGCRPAGPEQTSSFAGSAAEPSRVRNSVTEFRVDNPEWS